MRQDYCKNCDLEYFGEEFGEELVSMCMHVAIEPTGPECILVTPRILAVRIVLYWKKSLKLKKL